MEVMLLASCLAALTEGNVIYCLQEKAKQIKCGKGEATERWRQL